MTDHDNADGARDDAEVLALIPEGDDEVGDDHDPELARELAADLWADRDVSHVEANGAGDGDCVEVGKEGFLAAFSVSMDHEGVGISAVGHASFEVHDERGYYLLEDVEVEAGFPLIDRMNEAVEAVGERHEERRAREREFQRMVL